MSDIEKNEQNSVRELVAFRVGDQEYCVDIMSVREIRGWSAATPLPHSPVYVRGVINLRGTVLPIVDLSCRLGYGDIAVDQRNVIIVAQNGDQVVGLLVDAVSDILTVEIDKLQPTPDVASEVAKEFVRGVIAMEDRMIRFIEIGRILTPLQSVAA
ncbi:chemotaxis protein CheW [Parvularcula sp. LCG005]|uniref:chemotaxis protein CheW n=1 Tax=Parvularcula sp. LCG005 TaxID=3078805 RepID=UPI00294313DF|nr:chemotaxis protein CheW [Parvularcula sp. LCG005]WOI52615.1 chemotaxis protein CheW [Parvularcula sp. LCG005]